MDGPPTITAQPKNQESTPGGAASFSVMAVGVGTLNYQWRFEGGDLAGQIGDTLNLANVQPVNEGAYSVQVANTFGFVNSQPALLTLVGQTTLQNVEQLGNGTVRMTISGVPNRSYSIEISPNLTNWTTLSTILYTNGIMPFTDTTAGGPTNRFYRARLVPQ
jgi:hypothetical protein